MLSSVSFHKDFAGFRFATHEIGVVGASFKRDITPEALSALIHEPQRGEFFWRGHQNTQVSCSIERENDHCFKIAMGAVVVLLNTCGRCLNPLTQSFTLDFSIRMLNKQHLGLVDPEGEGANIEIDMSKEDDEVVGYFSGTCIDLGIILRDQIFLEVPDYPQCGGAHCSLPLSSGGYYALDHNAEHGNNPFAKLLKRT